MAQILAEIAGKVLTLLGCDGTDFYNVLVDTDGHLQVDILEGAVGGYVWVTGVLIVLGDLVVGGRKAPSLLAPADLTIDRVYLYIKTAPTGASVIADVNVNDTTIFTVQANRPEIAIAGHTGESGVPDVTAWGRNDRLDVDIDQIGSTIVGSELTVHVRCKQNVATV